MPKYTGLFSVPEVSFPSEKTPMQLQWKSKAAYNTKLSSVLSAWDFLLPLNIFYIKVISN